MPTDRCFPKADARGPSWRFCFTVVYVNRTRVSGNLLQQCVVHCSGLCSLFVHCSPIGCSPFLHILFTFVAYELCSTYVLHGHASLTLLFLCSLVHSVFICCSLSVHYWPDALVFRRRMFRHVCVCGGVTDAFVLASLCYRQYCATAHVGGGWLYGRSVVGCAVRVRPPGAPC